MEAATITLMQLAATSVGRKVSGRLKMEGLGSGMLKVFETMTFDRP